MGGLLADDPHLLVHTTLELQFFLQSLAVVGRVAVAEGLAVQVLQRTSKRALQTNSAEESEEDGAERR